MKEIMTTEAEIPTELIHDGIRFLRTMTEFYGMDEGMAIWDKMGDAIPANLRGQIFMAMLCGTTGKHINISAGRAGATGNAIAIIRCIRENTRLGLKEAKDIWDESRMRTVSVVCDPKFINKFSQDLRHLGCIVT